MIDLRCKHCGASIQFIREHWRHKRTGAFVCSPVKKLDGGITATATPVVVCS